jgi:hypothetical protein
LDEAENSEPPSPLPYLIPFEIEKCLGERVLQLVLSNALAKYDRLSLVFVYVYMYVQTVMLAENSQFSHLFHGLHILILSKNPKQKVFPLLMVLCFDATWLNVAYLTVS